jgi:hypothetical protein
LVFGEAVYFINKTDSVALQLYTFNPLQRMSHRQWSKQQSSVACDKRFITGQSSKYCLLFWKCIKYKSNFTRTKYQGQHKILILVSLSNWLWLIIEVKFSWRHCSEVTSSSEPYERAVRVPYVTWSEIPDTDWAVVQSIIREDFIAVCLIHCYSSVNNYRIIF